MASDVPTALLLDVSNLASRAYHVAEQGKKGQSVLGLARYGLKKIVSTLVREAQPLRIIAAVDEGPCFRHRLLPGVYKAGRKPKDPELTALRSEAAELIKREFGAEVFAAADGEADDVIATAANAMLPYGWRVLIASNDLDLTALVSGRHGDYRGIYTLQYHKGTYHALDEFGVEAKMGVPPHRVSLLKAIMGDTSDGYGGCEGLGKVAAQRLARSNPSMEAIFANLDNPMKVCPADAKKLRAFGQEKALVMERVANLDWNARLIAR